MQKQDPFSNPYLSAITTGWLDSLESEKALKSLRTEYHEVEKLTNSLAIKW